MKATNKVKAWTDGTAIDDVPANLWAVNKPSGNGSCVGVYSIVKGMTNYKEINTQNPILNGQWSDVNCSARSIVSPDGTTYVGGAVCKITASPCYFGGTFYNGSCYYVS